MKKSLLLLSLLFFSSNVRSMDSVVDADASKLFGGAKSSAELGSNLDKYLGSFVTSGGCHKEPDRYITKTDCHLPEFTFKRPEFTFKSDPFGWIKSLLTKKSTIVCGPGKVTVIPGQQVCTPVETVRIPNGIVDARIREVDASRELTQSYIDGLLRNRHVRAKAKFSTLEELDLRRRFLSEVGACHKQLKGDLEKAAQTVSVNAKDLDRIAKQDKLSANDISVVKTVNDAMKAPFERAQKCYSHVVTGDILAKTQVDLGEEMVKDGANAYAESKRYAEKLSNDLDRKVEIKRAELRRKELEARCNATGDSLDCWWETTKLAASDAWSGAKGRTADASDWVCDGWGVFGHKLKARYQESHPKEWLTSQYESVRDFGVCDDETCTASPSAYYGIQAGKVVGGAAAALVGAYAAYKLIKFGWNHGGSRLYNVLWGNRSKKVRVAMLMALGAAAVVAPSTAMHYGVMQP